MLKRSLAFRVVLPLSLWLGGCASYTDDIKQMHSDFRAGNYPAALATFEKSDVKTQDRNRLLYLLEKGMIEDRLSEREKSRVLWMKADKLADDLYTTSISKEVATYLYNEGAQAYAGEDYEKIAIHTMLAHSFLNDHQLGDAAVEAKRINTKLNEINGFYKDNKNKYRDDAYARYLSGLINEANGDVDGAIVDYRASLKAYEGDYSKNFKTYPPNDLVRALYRLLILRDRKDETRPLIEGYKSLSLEKTPLDSGSLVVVHEVGLINPKTAKEFILPLGGQVVRFSFPTIRKEGLALRQTGVRIDDGMFEPGEMSQNFNAIAYENLEDRRFRMIAKSAARLILKGQMTQKAEKEFGALGYLAGNIYGAVSETADTRSWTTLPASIYVTRVFLKPGSYSVEISNDGKLSDITKVNLRKNQVVLLRDAKAMKPMAEKSAPTS